MRKRQKSLSIKRTSPKFSPSITTTYFRNKNFSLKKFENEKFQIINERFNFNKKRTFSLRKKNFFEKPKILKFSKTLKINQKMKLKENFGSIKALNNILVKKKKKNFFKKKKKN